MRDAFMVIFATVALIGFAMMAVGFGWLVVLLWSPPGYALGTAAFPLVLTGLVILVIVGPVANALSRSDGDRPV